MINHTDTELFRNYDVDVCFCIDKTGLMRDLINEIKSNISHFASDFSGLLEQKLKKIDHLRVRFIFFGDFVADQDPLIESAFFDLPDEIISLENCLNSINVGGGGDIPENALEALSCAIQSDWKRDSLRKRQIIVLLTDAPTHELGHGKEAPSYPVHTPKNMSELCELWESDTYMDQRAKRLFAIVPDDESWNFLNRMESSSMWIDDSAGLCNLSYQSILNFIFNSAFNYESPGSSE